LWFLCRHVWRNRYSRSEVVSGDVDAGYLQK
jgi:hypothetical protein